MREELKHCPVCEATSFEEAVSTVDYSTSKEAFTVQKCTNVHTCLPALGWLKPKLDRITTIQITSAIRTKTRVFSDKCIRCCAALI